MVNIWINWSTRETYETLRGMDNIAHYREFVKKFLMLERAGEGI